MTISAIKKINEVLIKLNQDAAQVDNENQLKKSHRFVKDKPLFSIGLFNTDSDLLVDFVEEIQKKTIELEQLLRKNKNEFSHHRLLKIEQQISAVINCINSNKSIHNAEQVQQNMLKAKRLRQATEKIIQPTQSLYQKLAEHHEFERRLMVILEEKQQLLSRATPSKYESASEHVLVTHQRLGRCRQAISKIERQIELSEKR